MPPGQAGASLPGDSGDGGLPLAWPSLATSPSQHPATTVDIFRCPPQMFPQLPALPFMSPFPLRPLGTFSKLTRKSHQEQGLLLCQCTYFPHKVKPSPRVFLVPFGLELRHFHLL